MFKPINLIKSNKVDHIKQIFMTKPLWKLLKLMLKGYKIQVYHYYKRCLLQLVDNGI